MAGKAGEFSWLTGTLALRTVVASMADIRRSREPPAGASESYKKNMSLNLNMGIYYSKRLRFLKKKSNQNIQHKRTLEDSLVWVMHHENNCNFYIYINFICCRHSMYTAATAWVGSVAAVSSSNTQITDNT